MNRKLSIILALFVALMAFAVPGFAQDDPYADVDPTGQEITFWHQHTGARAEELDRIVANFNETNEWGITVVASNQGGYSDIFQKMNLGLTAGGEDLPNLVVAYGNQSASYQLVDGLVDMNPLVYSPTWGLSEEEIADFFPGFFNTDVINGERLGFPPNRSMEVLFYNADWMAELSAAGAISFDGPPTTPEQFREASCAATANPFSAATGDVAQSIGYQLSIDASRIASWTFAFGGDVFDLEANEYTYNSPAAVEAISFLQSLFAEGCAGPVVERFGDQTNFGQGTTLFTVGSRSGLPVYRSAVESGANFTWSVAAIPHTTPEPVQNIYGASVSIVRGTPEQELAAWLFMKYYTLPEVQADWALASNYFPVRASVAEELADYMAEDTTYKTAFDLLPFAIGEPQAPGYDFVRDLMETTLAAIVDDPSMDVQAALDAANAEANEILADQMM